MGRPRKWGVGKVVVAALLLLSSAAILHAWRTVRVFDQSADELIARSRHIRDAARPEYQSEVLAELPPSSVNGPFFRFDDHLADATVRAEPALADSAEREAGGTLYSFEFKGADANELIAENGESVPRSGEGILRVRQRGDGFLFARHPLQIPRDEIGEIVIRARASAGTEMVLEWSKAEHHEGPVWHHRISTDLISDTTFHTYVINARNALRRGLSSSDKVMSFGVRPSNSDGALVEIDYIRFISKRAHYLRYARGAAYETLGGQLRHVLYMLPAQELAFSLQVPERAPRLEFGTGVLMERPPVRFRATIEGAEAGTRTVLYDEAIANAAEWHDARLDLSKWAGRRVSLTLNVSGPEGNVAFWSDPVLSSTPARKFDVVIILQDALRADHLSAYGYTLPTAPATDSIMRGNGIVFLNAIVQAPTTRQSVPTLMTSLLPTTTGVWTFAQMLGDEYLTLAEILRSQGFVTASFIQNGNAGPYAGLHQGFGLLRDSESIGSNTEDILGVDVAAWIERHRDRNFFLYLHVKDPHGIYDPPPPFDGWYRDSVGATRTRVRRKISEDPVWLEHPTAEGRRLRYDGEIQHNDALLPDFFATLDSLGLEDSTLVILLADHGEYLGEFGRWGHFSPGHLQVLHVPLMFRYPARFPGSARIPQLVQLIDVMPTILDLAGIESDELLMQGTSLTGLIEERDPAYWENRVIVSEEPTGMSAGIPCRCGSLLFRQWHLLQSRKLSPAGFGPLHLGSARMLDFVDNPAEDRMSRSPLAYLLLRRRYGRVLDELQANDMAAQSGWKGHHGAEGGVYKVDPDVLKRLRGLGYVR